MEEEELKQELTYEIDASNGKHYSVKSSELNEFLAEAREEGVELSVTKPDKKEREEPEKWWSWKNLGEGVKGLWDDPTGEHGALAYMGLNLASGIGTAAGKVVGGMIKGVGDVGYGLARGVARGVETLVGADEHTVSGILEDAHDTFSDWFTLPDWFEKRGMYEGIEGAHETMGALNNFAEMVFAMKGMGLAARGAGAIAKAGMVGKGAKGLVAAKAATQAARIGQATVAAGMGGKTYAEMAADPEGPGGWRQEAAAAAAGGLEALTFGLMAPFKKMNMALPKPFEAMTRMEIAKRFAGECLKSGFMMGLVEAEKKGAEALATVGTDKRWHPETFEQALKSVGSQFLVGMGFHAVGAVGKAGEYMKWRGGEKGKDVALTFQVEQNRKIYAPRLDQQAQLALRAREVGAGWLEAGMEGTENVKRVLPSGAVEFNDGSVWQMGRDGRATITVSDGTILDARTGAVEGIRANREAAAPEEGSVSGDNIAGNQRAENAGLFLDLLEQGKLPTVAQPLEGLQITETSYKKGTVLDGDWDQAKAPPVIVWVGNDGTRVLVTGRSRAAAAAAAGVKEIKAVEVSEDQGWSRAQAESLDAVENMREGRGTREEIARGVEALGIRSVEDCDRYEIVPERPVVDAITVLNEGSEALKSAASEGTVGRAWAAECAEKLGKKSLGEASERAQATALDMIAGKLPPEEAGAAMDALAELAARKPDYTDREAADAIRAARERAVGRVAVDADSEMVEMPDGTIKSVAEAKAEGAAQAQEAAAEGKTVDESGWLPKAPAAQGADKAAEPTVKADGSVGCVRFEGAKATRTRSEDGREIVLIEGMTGEEMMRPENRDAAVQFVTRLKEMAGDVDLVFADVSAADAAEALLMAARVKARAEEARSSVSGDTIAGSGDLVAAGQRLVDGLFGEKSGIRVRTGTREEAEAALRAAGETKPIKDAEGQVQGYYHRGKGEVVLFEGADVGTLAHEIGWHAVWHWAERNSPDLLLKMKRYAARTPLELKAQIKEVYGDFKGDALMDEIGAGRFERAMGERFQKLLAKSPEVRGWWRKVLHALARAWKGMARTVGGNRIDLKKIEKMDPEEAIEALTAQMLEGRRLGEGIAKAEGEVRPSIAGRKGAEKLGVGKGADAEAMEKAGASREEIWRKTGWWRAKDGQWRFEMPSTKMKDARELYSALIEGNNETKLEKILNAPELFKAYPQLRDTKIILSPDRVNPGEAAGWYDRIKNEIVLLDAGLVSLKDMPARERDLRDTYQKVLDSDEFVRRRFADMDAFGIEHGTIEEEREYARWWIERQDKGINRTNEARIRDLANDRKVWSVFGKIIHEVQHAVQRIEGFATGASGDEEGYSRFTGEVEARNAARREAMTPEERAATPPWATEDVPEDRQIIRFSRKKMNELAKSKVGSWVEGTSADGVRNAIEERIEKGLPEGEYRFKQLGDRARLVRGAVKFYKRFAQKTVMLSDGRCAYFVPDERARARGLSNEEAWAEYAIHAVTSSGQKLEGKEYAERLYNATKAQNMWRVENILKAERCEAKIDANPERDAVIFFGRGVDGKIVQVITRLDERGNIYADLAEVTMLNGGKMKKLPPRKPLTEVVEAVANRRQRGGLLTADAESIPQQGGGAQGEIRPSIRNREERRVTPEEDAAYEDAVKRGDMETVRRMEREVYERMGYSKDSGYQGTSAFNGAAPSRNAYFETKAERIEAAKNGEMEDTTTLGDFRDGIDVNNLQFIVFDPRSERNADPMRQEAIQNIRGVLDGGKETITMYRSVPADVKEGQFRNGDWITPSRAYAEDNARIHGWGKKFRVIEQEVSVEDVWWDGNDIAEWGFDDGKGSVYKNTRANRKLLGPTYDKAGNLIPLSKRFNDMHVDMRYSRRGKRRDEVYDDVLKAVRAGSVRVAVGKSERTDAGWDAGANLYLEREGQAGPSQDGSMTLAYSEALRLYRALNASAHMPKVLEKMPHLATRDRKGRLKLNAAAFGIVDRSDMEAVKAGLKKEGMFLHEDAEWRMRNGPEEVRAMKEMSEMAFQEQLENLAEARVKGKMSGGGRTAVNILAKEIGRIACELPVTPGAPKSLKHLRVLALGMGIAPELANPKGELGREAREAAQWWREQDPVRRDATATKSDKVAPSELWAEMFGMFLADPVGLEAHAPKVYGKMVEAIAGNEKLSEAWNALRRTRDAEGPHERVMRDIERQWQANEQSAYKELLAELDKPIGNWKKRTRARLLLEMHSTEGPAVMWVTDAVHEKLAELKRLKKAGKIDKDQYDLLAGGAKRELEKLRVALLHKQRGGATGRLYALDFAEHIMDEVAKDGVQLDDLRRYLYAKSVRDGMHQKGKAAALGMDQREADKVLTDLEGRLGADGWTRLETAAKRFQALREQHILENEFVLEAFGRDLVGYWRMNASYVRSERTWTAEEVEAYRAAREDWMKRHPGESTVIAEIEALMDMHALKGSGASGSSFLKPLAGSLKAVKDPLAATLENDLRIVEFAQRNHWACSLAEASKTLGLEGFAVMEDRGGGGRLKGSNRYGSVTFLKDGRRMTLVMPKVVAEGFEYEGKGVTLLAKFNRGISAILTQYSPRFALRNIWRNRASNANNIAWMGEGRFVTAAGLVGMRPVARLATFLLERAAAHLPDRFARNAFMNLLYGPTTNIYFEGQGTRIMKMIDSPQILRQRVEEAEKLAAQGKTAKAQLILEDIEKAKAAMKLPIFAGIRQRMFNKANKTDLDAVFHTLGMETNFDGKKVKGIKRVWRAMMRTDEEVKRFNDSEERRVKLIALLAAEHEAELARAQGREAPRSRDEIIYQVATMSGSPRYENRGRAMNYIENALGPFMNVGMKGAWRTLEAMRYDPKAWWTKAASRIAGRVATSVMWMGGGYVVVAKWMRENWAGDDEDRNKIVDAFERFGKRMARALANCSDYRLRNYDIVPVGLYGKWSTLVLSMPRGDEDKLLMPAVDMLVHGMLGSEKAQEMGFTMPMDLNYGGGDAAYNTFLGSGLLPDPMRRGLLWAVAQDAIMPWFGYNPYNSYTQRSVYNQADIDARMEEPWNLGKKVLKQVWNDLGGQVVMPSTTWDEDEGAYEDQGKWALSTAEEGEEGCMPIGGKTIFHALHSIPFLSAAASGLITMQNGGNERIARRLEEYRNNEPLRATANQISREVIEIVRKKGQDYDYGPELEARIGRLELPEEDKEIIESIAFEKVRRVADKMGMTGDPIKKVLEKMSTNEKLYRRALRQVEAEGWDGDFD